MSKIYVSPSAVINEGNIIYQASTIVSVNRESVYATTAHVESAVKDRYNIRTRIDSLLSRLENINGRINNLKSSTENAAIEYQTVENSIIYELKKIEAEM